MKRGVRTTAAAARLVAPRARRRRRGGGLLLRPVEAGAAGEPQRALVLGRPLGPRVLEAGRGGAADLGGAGGLGGGGAPAGVAGERAGGTRGEEAVGGDGGGLGLGGGGLRAGRERDDVVAGAARGDGGVCGGRAGGQRAAQDWLWAFGGETHAEGRGRALQCRIKLGAIAGPKRRAAHRRAAAGGTCNAGTSRA